MKHYFSYGTKENDYELLKRILAEAFSIEFTDRESSWWGEYALWRGESELSIKIYPNYVEGEGYHEEEKVWYLYLLEIPGRSDPDFIQERMKNLSVLFELIRHEEL